MSDMQDAFSGLKVLDFTAGVAGPHATQLMALHGADVIKIEPLKGEWGRTLGRAYGEHTAHSIAFNRGKKSMAVDLKNPDVREAVKTLVKSADVVAESFRPGVMARLGLSYDELAGLKPDLIYLSVSGFGQQGPYVNRPVTDAVIQAFSGWMTMNANEQGIPQRSRMVAMDVMTGLYGANAVAMALISKLRFNRGKWIDCNLMQAAAAFQTPKMIEYHLQDGDTGNLYAPVGAYPTRNGQINITAMRDDHFIALCRVLGREDLVGDPKYQTGRQRLENERELNKVLFSEFAKKDSEYWAAHLTQADVMNSIVYNYSDYFDDPHVDEVESFQWLDHPGVGMVPVPVVPGAPELLISSPDVGEHTEATLRSAGLSNLNIESLDKLGAIYCGR
ncbi:MULTISPECIES: CaiB/BaiF CoA transferase family protein [unclassified Sulfitobacter]|nr:MULTISPECIES: CoA transferase [unclassified Sulfitobacter]